MSTTKRAEIERAEGSHSEQEIDLGELFDRLWPHRKVIVEIAAVFTLLFLLAALVMPRWYQSKIVLAPASTNEKNGLSSAIAGQFGGLASLAGINLGGNASSEEAFALLSSRMLVDQLIRDENLLPVLFPSDWDEEAGAWEGDDPSDIPTFGDAYEKFDNKIRAVSQDIKAGIVTLTITWKDPVLAARWADSLVKRLNESMRSRAILESEKSLAFLNEELAKASTVEMRQAIYNLIEIQAKNAMYARVQDEYAYKVVDPAFVADPDDYVKPMPVVFAVFGFIMGSVIGVISAFLRDRTAE